MTADTHHCDIKDARVPLKRTEARYSRHHALAQIGKDGQALLKDSKVLIVGAGGLGSPAALYLAAAGVGHLGIVDDDCIDITNLQRQILFNESQIGQSKAVSATNVLEQLNSDITIRCYNQRLQPKNAPTLIDEYDVIVDASDNFETRFLINQLCITHHKKLVWAAIDQFKGQVSVVNPKTMAHNNEGCFACFCHVMPKTKGLPNCASQGILGSVAGVVGTLQATEVIKLLLSIGESLNGYVLRYDALTQELHKVRLMRRPSCEVCIPKVLGYGL